MIETLGDNNFMLLNLNTQDPTRSYLMRNKPPNEEQMIFFTFLSRYAELKGDSGNTEKNSSSRIDRHQNFGIWTSIRRDRPRKPLKIASSEEGHFERFFGSISANTGPNSEILTSVDPSRRVLFSSSKSSQKKIVQGTLERPFVLCQHRFLHQNKVSNKSNHRVR